MSKATARAVFTQHIEQASEVGAQERPATQDFLGPLVDIHDDDAGVGVCVLARAIAEARVERVQLETLVELEDRRGPLAEKRQNAYQQRGGGEAQADPERDLVLPPGAPDGLQAAWALAIRFARYCAGRGLPAASRLPEDRGSG